MNFIEIWQALEVCSGNKIHIIIDSFYPEFLEAITPKTASFKYMSDLKEKLIEQNFDKNQIIQILNEHPVYGAYVNTTGCAGFNYELFFSIISSN